jgi:error-prone DNA polymerase
VPLF